MTRTELLEIIKNGESSGVEFKRDTIDNRALAKEIMAFANLAGGPLCLINLLLTGCLRRPGGFFEKSPVNHLNPQKTFYSPSGTLLAII